MRTYNIDQLRDKRIIVNFDSWPSTSEFPLVHFVRTIGNVGDPTA
jgi:exoribonuclease R